MDTCAMVDSVRVSSPLTHELVNHLLKSCELSPTSHSSGDAPTLTYEDCGCTGDAQLDAQPQVRADNVGVPITVETIGELTLV